MTLRKIETIKNEDLELKAIIYRDSEWNEYTVKFHQHENYQTESDYHTDDKEDAQNTARHFCEIQNK